MHPAQSVWQVHIFRAMLGRGCLCELQACNPAHAPRLQLVVAGVPRQRGVVALDVELKLALQAVRAQEVHGGGRIPVVLVLGRLLGCHRSCVLKLRHRKFMVVAAFQWYWCLVGSWVPQELRV